jgi:prepilin-type N-terminal cleavage/methylation domain-containing protein
MFSQPTAAAGQDCLPYYYYFSHILKGGSMKKRKNEQGFTLVEVIVVAVIVAVLAAVAIPLYNGYIRDSRTNVCQNNAATIASSFTAKIAQNGNFATTAATLSGNNITIASEVTGGPNSTIVLPKGYTFSATATAVTVNGPGNSTASVNYQ